MNWYDLTENRDGGEVACYIRSNVSFTAVGRKLYLEGGGGGGA